MPHFKFQTAPLQRSYDAVMSGGTKFVDATVQAQELSKAQYDKERDTTAPRGG